MRGLALAALMLGGTAHADPIEWHAPRACGDVSALSARVTEQLGRPLRDDDGRVVVRIVRDHEFIGSIEIHTPRGEDTREVHASACAQVVEAAAFVIALAVRELAAEAPIVISTPAAPVLPPPPAARVEVRPVIGVAVVAHRAARSIGARVAASAVVAAGIVPSAGIGADVTLAVERRRFALEVATVALAPTRALALGDTGVEVGMVGGAARGCVRAGRLRGCLGGVIGSMRGTGIGVEMARTAHRRWSAVTLGAGGALPLGRHLAVQAGLELAAGLERPRFTLDDGTLLFQPAPVAATASLAIAFQL